jgi:ParB family chromosome partitioning protein
LTGEKAQKLAADRIRRDGLNVRQTEALVAHLHARETATATSGPSRTAPTRDAHVAHLEDRLRERLGTKVQLRYSQGKGALEIHFFSDPELERVLQLLGISPE